MTTKSTHQEPGDVDATVVEYSSVQETTTDDSAVDTLNPVPATPEGDTAVPSATVDTQTTIEAEPVASSIETPDTQQILSSTTSSQEQQDPQDNSTGEKQDQNTDVAPASASAEVSVEQEAPATEEDTKFPFGDAGVLPEKTPEEVRPFTAFIEEFRQAEARFNATVRETQTESFPAFPLLTPNEAELATSEQQTTGSSPAAIAEAANAASASSPDMVESAQQVEEPKEEKKEEPPVRQEKPVSPLLRPATRMRSRHTRHHREEPPVEIAPADGLKPVPTTVPPVQPELPASLTEAMQAQREQQEAERAAAAATTEPEATSEPPRPARRYRFDRPAKTTAATKATSPTPAPVSPLLVPAPAPQINETKPAPAVEPQPAPVSKASQEATVEVSQPASTQTEHGRRRPMVSPKEQTQPQVAQTPAAPVAPSEVSSQPAIVEAVSQPVEIAPEDLPPLEYADLQKNSTRRRRRHRSNGTAPAPETTSGQPAALARPATPTPPAPSAPAPTAITPPYSIVSGYTVSQMNQGNDIAGPFMGPEPSPARGSTPSRDGRTTARADIQVQRTSLPASRTHEGPSAASMHHFANMVSQAIQLQTDRMVAEMRRVNQAPTNVSVSLPPFPSTERVGVFVDVANLLYSARTLRIAVDFGKLLDFLRGNRRLVRAHAYCPTSPQPGDDQMFLQAVKGLGYRITTKNYKTFSSGAKKADLDLDLCMDVVRLVEGRAVDCIILVSGDSDFMPMLDYCSDHGVRVEVAAFDEAMSATLRQSCDLFVNLSMLEEIRA